MSMSDKRAQVSANNAAILENVQKVHEAGYNKGYSEGVASSDAAESYERGKAEGIEEGKQAEYDAFWDAYQDYGNRTDCQYMFASWTTAMFNPKYVVKPNNCTMMFAYSSIDVDVFNHPMFDFSELTTPTQMFTGSAFTRLGAYTATKYNGLRYMFYDARQLISIEMLIVGESSYSSYYENTFTNCEALEEVRFEGVIAHTGLNFNWSPLSVASMKSIISCLADLTGTAGEGVYTIKFSSTCWETLEADSKPADLVDEEGNYILKVPDGYDITQFSEETWTTYVRDALKWAI